MSPSLDEKFKYVEDVKYERNTAGYRRHMVQSRLNTRDETSKRMAEARAGNIDYLRRSSLSPDL